MNGHDQVNVIGHNNGSVDPDAGITSGNIPDLLLDDPSDAAEADLGRGKPLPYGDIRQKAAPILRTDGDEIRSGT